MIVNKGCGVDELYAMPLNLFLALYVYEEIVNPNSAQIQQIRHTELIRAIYLSTGNVPKQHLGNFTLTELDSLNLISNKTMAEQAEEREKRIAEEQKKQMLSWIKGT